MYLEKGLVCSNMRMLTSVSFNCVCTQIAIKLFCFYLTHGNDLRYMSCISYVWYLILIEWAMCFLFDALLTFLIYSCYKVHESLMLYLCFLINTRAPLGRELVIISVFPVVWIALLNLDKSLRSMFFRIFCVISVLLLNCYH